MVIRGLYLRALRDIISFYLKERYVMEKPYEIEDIHYFTEQSDIIKNK